VAIKNKKIHTGSLSSYQMALEIADLLKTWIRQKHFYLSSPVSGLPPDEKVNLLNFLSEDEL